MLIEGDRRDCVGGRGSSRTKAEAGNSRCVHADPQEVSSKVLCLAGSFEGYRGLAPSLDQLTQNLWGGI